MSDVTYATPAARLNDVPGYVHGIVGVDPWVVQCDGCGLTATGMSAGLTVLTSGIEFNPGATGDGRRLCRDCRKVEPDSTWRADL